MLLFFFYQNLLFHPSVNINCIHDLKFSLPFIKTVSIGRYEKNIVMLPRFLIPGTDLKIFHRNSGKEQILTYRNGLIDWDKLFNELPVEMICHDLD